MANQYKDKDLQLWKEWKANPSNATLKPLLTSLNPLIESNVNKLHGNLPRSALKAQMIKLTINALPNYDPEKAQLNTYLNNTAGNKLHRYVYTYQNMGSIPEPRAIQIGTFKRVKDNLENDLGRPPTYEEIGDQMHLPVKQIKLLEKEIRQDLIQDEGYTNIFGADTSETDENLVLLHAELFGQDREVMEYLYGMNGKPQLEGNEIAKKLNISPSMVVQIKNRVANRLASSGVMRGY